MIKQTTLDELRAKMDVHEVVGHFIEVKRDKACCPFHDERTPSFHLSRPKQIFKCFGCGAGGDAITFVMKHKRMNFYEAVRWLCEWYNITIEEDQAAAAEAQEKKESRTEMMALLTYAQKKYEDVLQALPSDAAAVRYLVSRGFLPERIRSWSLGYAPDDWRFLTPGIVNMAKLYPAADVGLVSINNGQNFDFYRNRITIPIHDHNGVLIGFGARWVPTGNAEEDKRQAKYFNPKESLVYVKSKVWFALNLAQRAIKERGFAYVVEGYLDAMAMHDAGINNTVASCGTEIDDAQVKLLKRYTTHVVLCYDGDDAGTRKMMKQVDLFLRHDCKVQVAPLPGGMDPDEFIRDIEFTNAEMATEGAYCD